MASKMASLASSEELVFESPALPEGLEVLLEQRAADLFAICDQEDKGFVTKRDMQRLRNELPLSPEQLENVFDQLDQDQNSYLTLEEFTQGFEEFLGIQDHRSSSGTAIKSDGKSTVETNESKEDIMYVEQKPLYNQNNVDDEEEQFEALLQQLGVKHLVGENDEALRAMWENLNTNPNPEIMAAFEDVLAKLTGDLERKTAEQEDFENTLKNRQKSQEEHLQVLYEEMEQQIQRERKVIRAEEEQREKRTRKELEAVLEMKDAQVNGLLLKQKTMQAQLEEVKGQVPEIKEENLHLIQEKQSLGKELERQRLQVLELQDQLDVLRNQTTQERKMRANVALKISENIAQERESLVKELDMLRSVNTKLLDEKDMRPSLPSSLPVQSCYSSNWRSLDNNALNSAEDEDDLEEGRENLANPKCTSLVPLSPEEEKIILMESAGEDLRRLRRMKPLQPPDVTSESEEAALPVLQHKRRRHKAIRQSSADNVSLYEELANSIEEEKEVPSFPLPLPELRGHDDEDQDADKENESSLDLLNHHKKRPLQRRRSKSNHAAATSFQSNLLIYTNNGHGNGSNGIMDHHHHLQTSVSGGGGSRIIDDTETDLSSMPLDSFSTNEPTTKLTKNPERVFKAIFIGDSSVGKSSLISRFCHNQFRTGAPTSTIGVDFQNRSLQVDQTTICLQCWDTAGQERYRSITRQYFRKADAVVVVYDITNEKSFLNAKNWILSAQEAVPDDSIVFLLLGNKLDRADDDVLRYNPFSYRKIRKADGLKLSNEFDTLFAEVSAADGRYVEENLCKMSRILLEKQDLDIKKSMAVSLHNPTQKKKKLGCC